MRHTSRSLLAVAVTILLPAITLGQTSNWTNAAGGAWSLNTNWDTPPAVGGSATTQLGFGLSATYTATNDLTGVFALNSILFSNTTGTTVTVAASGGSSLNFTGATPFISINGAGNAIISSPMSFDQVDTTIQGTGTGSLTFTGAVTEAVPATSNLLKTSTGNLTLSGGGSIRQLSIGSGSGFITGGTLALTAPTGAVGADLNGLSGLQVGTAANTANLTISGAGTIVNVTENIYVADGAGSTAVMTVRDGAVVNNVSAVSGRFGVGNLGNGTLNVLNGGVINTSLFFVSRIAPGGVGTVLIDGTNSAVNATIQISAGTANLGTITIQNGGRASSGNTVNIGRTVGGVGNGVVIVDGQGSLLEAGTTTNTGTIVPGREGNGTLTVRNGASATASFPGGTNSAMIMGLGPGAANGILNVETGGTVALNGVLRAGLVVPATAIINVSGTGSLLSSTEQIHLGGNGPTLGGATTTTVSGGGIISAANLMVLHSAATTNVNAGGTLRAGIFVDGAATSIGNITTQAGGIVGITGVTGTTGTYSGVISGGGSLTRSGVGGQILAGTSTYTGGTTINGGDLAVIGQISGPVTVNNGGSLIGGGASGSPLANIAGNVLVNSGGTLSGGDGTATNLTGVVNISGAVTMSGGSTLGILINGNTPGAGTTNHDQINLLGGGSMTLGSGVANLAAAANTLALTPADMIVIVNGGAVSGTFSGLPNGTVFLIPNAAGAPGVSDFYQTTITYSATSIVLGNFQPVPEPFHILGFAGLAAGGLGWWKKRKKA